MGISCLTPTVLHTLNMKVAIVLLACVAYAAASGYDQDLDPNYQAGFTRGAKGVFAPYRNSERQRAVNEVARKVGSGTGTAQYYDVPGTDGFYRGYGSYSGYGHAGYGAGYNAGYGYGARNAGYGYNAGYNAGYGYGAAPVRGY